MRMHAFFLIGLLCLALPGGAAASRNVIETHVENAMPTGSGRLTYLFWQVYDATLYAPAGAWSPKKPYALKLDYLIDLKGQKIAQRSIEEMKRQGLTDPEKIVRWEREMAAIFPDVKGGQSITGVRNKNGETLFYGGSRLIGTIKDREFTDRFFAIWLSPKTSVPSLRESLLGNRR